MKVLGGAAVSITLTQTAGFKAAKYSAAGMQQSIPIASPIEIGRLVA